MKSVAVCLAFLFAALSTDSCAQIRAPSSAQRVVADQANVIMDRGAMLELLPSQRVVSVTAADGKPRYSVTTAAPTSGINSMQMGLIFNHALQQTGVISGEISFQLKLGSTVSGWSESEFPGLRLIVKPDVYVVNTRTPEEFMAVLKRLQGSVDVTWVEPTIRYGLILNSPGLNAQ